MYIRWHRQFSIVHLSSSRSVSGSSSRNHIRNFMKKKRRGYCTGIDPKEFQAIEQWQELLSNENRSVLLALVFSSTMQHSCRLGPESPAKPKADTCVKDVQSETPRGRPL